MAIPTCYSEAFDRENAQKRLPYRAGQRVVHLEITKSCVTFQRGMVFTQLHDCAGERDEKGREGTRRTAEQRVEQRENAVGGDHTYKGSEPRGRNHNKRSRSMIRSTCA